MSHRIIWFDLPVVDLKRASTFYTAVLNIEISEDYPGVAVMSHETGDVAGCLYEKEGDVPSDRGVLLYFNVDGRLDEAVSGVVPNGGSVLAPIHELGEWGKRAIVMDSEGNRIALHSS